MYFNYLIFYLSKNSTSYKFQKSPVLVERGISFVL